MFQVMKRFHASYQNKTIKTDTHLGMVKLLFAAYFKENMVMGTFLFRRTPIENTWILKMQCRCVQKVMKKAMITESSSGRSSEYTHLISTIFNFKEIIIPILRIYLQLFFSFSTLICFISWTLNYLRDHW